MSGAEGGYKCWPECEYEPGHVERHPCGKVRVPGAPCQFCEKPTPLDGTPCPECCIRLDGLALADIKALFAHDDELSLDPPRT